jgi:hypothetical protein
MLVPLGKKWAHIILQVSEPVLYRSIRDLYLLFQASMTVFFAYDKGLSFNSLCYYYMVTDFYFYFA